MEHVEGRFRLPAEQALALAVEDSPVFVAGGAVVLAALFLDKDKIVAAMRGRTLPPLRAASTLARWIDVSRLRAEGTASASLENLVAAHALDHWLETYVG